MLQINIKGQKTVSDNGAPLCHTCNSCVLQRGRKIDSERVYCHILEKVIREEIFECSAYTERGKMSLYDMKQIAWVIGMDKRSRSIGFYRPGEFADKKGDKKIDFGIDPDPDGLGIL